MRIEALCWKPQSCTGEWDFETCICFPIDPPSCASNPNCAVMSAYPNCQCTSCVSTACPNNLPRYPPPSCKCSTCTPPGPTPPNKVWLGYPHCMFVCDPNLPACLNGQPRDSNCNCPTTCITQACALNQLWSSFDCKCICKFPRVCSSGKIWDDETCRCVSPLLLSY